MTKEQRKRLRELANAATGGRDGHWYVEGEQVRFDCSPETTESWVYDCTIEVCTVHRLGEDLDAFKCDREYIAFANPQTILSLLDLVERLEAFVIRCKNHSQCAATVLVAAQVLSGHDVREALEER